MVSLANLKYIDFPNICRICFQKNDLKNIFNTVIGKVKLVDILKGILNEQVIEDEKPQNICATCINLLMHPVKQYIFIKMFEDSKKALQNVLELKKDVEEKLKMQRIVTNVKEPIKKDKITDFDGEFQMVCQICNLDFSNDPFLKNEFIDKKFKDYLIEHIRREHLLDINEMKCLKCKKKYLSLNELKTHFTTVKHRWKSCGKCKSKFNTIKECFVHMQDCKIKRKLAPKKEIYECKHCNTKIELFENVFKHYKEKHSSNKACIICNKIYLQHMKLHIYSKHRPCRMKFLCNKCFIFFDTNEELLNHKLTADHSLKKCEICNEVYKGRKDNHMQKRHRKYEIGICDLCGKMFKQSQNLIRHYKTEHLGKRFTCNQCSKNYTTYFALEKHIESYHSECTDSNRSKLYKKAVRSYKCPICDKQFYTTNKKQIRMHEIFHERGDKVVCLAADCDLTFPDNGSRLEHMLQSHETFTCTDCKKKFFTNEKFETHCLVHTWRKEATFFANCSGNICHICQEPFEELKELVLHVSRTHKIHLCPVEQCGEIFRSSNNLSTHKKIGLHGNKHSCSVCTEKFNSKELLLEHQKNTC